MKQMASERQKQAVLQAIRSKIDVADRIGLKAMAQNWRELYVNVEARPAVEIIAPAVVGEPTGAFPC